MNKVPNTILILASLTLAACGGLSSNSTAAIDSIPTEYVGKTNPFGADVAAGAQVFKSNCASCHGEGGHGDGPAGAALDPQPKNLAELQKQAGDDYLFWRINTGKAGTAMVAWKGALTEDQIWQVISFLHTLK